MANVRSDIIIQLKEKGIERGYRCGQKPGGHYFEKKNGKWTDLEESTVEGVFKKKGWKIPAAPEKAAKKPTTKKAAGKKPAKKAVKKNAKPKAPKAKPESQAGSEPEAQQTGAEG